MNRAAQPTSQWSTFGHDLLVSIDEVPRGRWGSHLCEQIRDGVRNGSLHPGVRLPATRTLAHDLGLSRGVVSGVYDQLKAEGYLTARPGSGTIVAESLDIASARPASAERPTRQRPSPGLPRPDLFPRREWLRAYRRVVEHLPDDNLRYPDPQGHVPLREALTGHLGRVRGIQTRPEQILIVNGFAQGLAVLAQVLSNRGITSVSVEDPGSTGTRTQLNDWGLATPPVEVDEQGIKIDSLHDSEAPVVLITPAHQYPTGVVLTPARRHQLLRWVRDKPGRYIIEDDYDAEFRYDHAPVGSLQPLDPQRVISGSSVSKTLTPALRLGWLVLPAELIADAVAVKAKLDLGNSVFDQATLAELLRTGALDRHLRKSRIEYRALRQRVAQHLAVELPSAQITGLEAGLNICLHLDRTTDDASIAEHLRDIGVRCEALSHYQQRSDPIRGLVLDITSAATHHLDALTDAIRSKR